MSRSLGNTIADSLELALAYAERLLADVPDDKFARFACPGGEQVTSNHAAFLLGHLATYPEKLVTLIGGDVAAAKAPEGFEQLFSKDATCQDDPDGTIYPAKDAIVAAFNAAQQAALAELKAAPDDVFAGPNPTERLAERFPTIGSMCNFYVGGHTMLHLGQFSAWRRMIGLGAA